MTDDRRAMLQAGGLGWLSGMVTHVTLLYQLGGIAVGFAVPGTVLGAVLGFWLWRRGQATALNWGLFAVCVGIAWIAAYWLSVRIANDVNNLLLVGLFGGFVGATLMVVGGALLFAFYRNPRWVALTIIMGTVLGMLLAARFDDKPWVLLMPLFVIWQAAMGASFGYAAAKAMPAKA
ncbi:MAG: hypothetical protein AB7G15_02260 [Alphaproteobacteria bacterium]